MKLNEPIHAEPVQRAAGIVARLEAKLTAAQSALETARTAHADAVAAAEENEAGAGLVAATRKARDKLEVECEDMRAALEPARRRLAQEELRAAAAATAAAWERSAEIAQRFDTLAVKVEERAGALVAGLVELAKLGDQLTATAPLDLRAHGLRDLISGGSLAARLMAHLGALGAEHGIGNRPLAELPGFAAGATAATAAVMARRGSVS